MGSVTSVLSQGSTAITDAGRITSKARPGLPDFNGEKLMVTRDIREADWLPDRKRIAFISNISGRPNLWLIPAEGGWPVQLTISNQQQD